MCINYFSVQKHTPSRFTRYVLKNRLWHRCFTVNLAKFLGGPFFTEHLRWLLLEFQVFLLIKYFSTFNRSSHTMQYFYIAYWYSNIYGCRYVSKISFCLLSLPLEREETLKYRCVCRPLFGKV